MDLRTRAQNFLDLPIPRGVDYGPDSAADMFIRNYTEAGDFDDELVEMGERAIVELDEALDEGPTAEVQEYFIECKSIVSEILAELGVD